jgi:2-amino-4-hydroxy-6-hydroxymethyldihydropteridine diphosphokinase
MTAVSAFIAIGANLGNAQAAVLQAMQDLGTLADTVLVRRSALYRTAPVDSSGPDYINAVVEISTGLSAPDLLVQLQRLETDAARTRPYRNAPRTLDLDMLLYDEEVINTASLVVPHPRMMQRAFVLVPLAEIAPQRVSAAQLQAVHGQGIARIADQASSAISSISTQAPIGI